MKIKALGLATLCLGLALTAMAQRGPRGGFQEARGPGPEVRAGSSGERGDRNPLGRLVSALDLNEAQVAAVEALLAARIEATQAIQEQIQALRQSIPDLIAAGDPTPIGNSVLAQHALQEQLRAIAVKAGNEFKQRRANEDKQRKLMDLELSTAQHS